MQPPIIVGTAVLARESRRSACPSADVRAHYAPASIAGEPSDAETRRDRRRTVRKASSAREAVRAAVKCGMTDAAIGERGAPAGA